MYEILIILLFVWIFRIIPSSCSTTTVTRRWCPCGFVAGWRRGELRDIPDAPLDYVEAWKTARGLQSELHLYALLLARAQKSLDVENFM